MMESGFKLSSSLLSVRSSMSCQQPMSHNDHDYFDLDNTLSVGIIL